MDPPDGGSSEPVWAKTPICGVDADLENCGVKFSHSEKKTCGTPYKRKYQVFSWRSVEKYFEEDELERPPLQVL